MRRLLAIGAVGLFLAFGVGQSAARTHASVKSIAGTRERVALREAGALLLRIPLPAGAVRVTHLPQNQDLRYSGVGTSTITMFAERHAFWRVPGSVAAVARFARRHPAAGLVSNGGGGRPLESETLQFSSRFQHPLQRMASVTAVNVGGATYVRVDAAAAWIYPRSPLEALPAGVREIDISGSGGVQRRVTSRSDVRRIVRWFGQLSVTPPGAIVSCVAITSARLTFSFRSAGHTVVANAAVPDGGASGCEPVSFTLHGKAQTPLVDTTAVAFSTRVERLLHVCFDAGRTGPQTPLCERTWAGQLATRLLDRLELPAGAQRLTREPKGDGGLLRQAFSISGGNELVDRHRLWRVRGSLTTVEAFVKEHQPAAPDSSATAGGGGVPDNHTLDFPYVARDTLISSRQLEITFVALPGGWTAIRADAQVVWIYPRTEAQMPPPNTRVITVKSGSFSRRITDSPTVDRIVRRFSNLHVVQPGTTFHCPLMLGARRPYVEITFRALDPVRTARAVVPGPGASTACSPIVFLRGGRGAALVGGDFAQWLEGVLGVTFR